MESMVTVGRNFQKDYSMMLSHSSENVLDWKTGFKERFKVIFIEEGSGIIKIAGEKHLFVAPVIFCFNEIDSYSFEYNCQNKAEAILFHPSIINDRFNFSKVRKDEDDLSITELQDAFWLIPFCRRPSGFFGQLNIGPGTAKRIRNIFNCIIDELELQRDANWPCNSRTFLIELLFLITRTMEIPESTESITLKEELGEIGKVILYLYANYMNKISITELTRVFHLNRTTLAWRFNEVTGMSIISYLIKLRINLAAKMLVDTTLNISQILEKVGFNDATHFGRTFKKYIGCSPSEYREKNCTLRFITTGG